MIKASLLGGSGFAGAEILRRLLGHPEVDVVRVGAADHLGEPLASAHPHLEGKSDLRFEALTPEQAVDGVDIVIMGLPHDVSVGVMQAAHASPVRVLDLSGAFRLGHAETYERYYGQKHPNPELLAQFVYGLPEWNRDQVARAKYVASPGCFATCVQLGLAPFARAGLLRGSVNTVAATGSSGAGAQPLPSTHHPIRSQNLKTYKPLVHPHAPEITEQLVGLGAEGLSLSFVPVSAPLSRGIFAMSFFLVQADTTDSELHAVLRDAYHDEYFVRVPEQRLPEVVAVSNSNYAEVGLVTSEVEAGFKQVVVFSAIDNLIKGGAGQAVQNLNCMFGFEESLTLQDPGSYP